MATARVEDWLGETTLEGLERPIGEACGLPRQAYADPAYLELENERLFARQWTCAGAVHDVPQPGDVMPVEVAGQPIVLVHGHDGEIRAFHNICRHRGTKLVWQPCSKRAVLTCPYHAWSYGLDGALRQRPAFGGPGHDDAGAIPRDELGLKPVRLARWHHWLFVNLSGTAPAFDDYAAPFLKHFQPWDYDALELAESITFDFESNWKFVQENFLESYHLPYIHKVLDDDSPAADHMRVSDGVHLGQPNEQSMPDHWSSKAPPQFPDLPDHLKRRGEYSLLFPNFWLWVWPDHAVGVIHEALAPDHTHQRWFFYFIGDAATDDAHEPGRREVIDRWITVNEEDRGVCQAQQEGRASRAADGGVFSPYWDELVHDFQKLCVKMME